MMLSLAPIDTGAAERTFLALKCIDLDAAVDIATWSGYPSFAAVPINPAINVMGQDRNVSVLTERTDT